MIRERLAISKRARLLGLVALAALLLSACGDLSYYWQAMNGQMEILRKRRPIADVLEDPAVSQGVKGRLRLAAQVQEFSIAELSLPTEGAYRTYANLGRPFVSWLVVAAPALELREHTWCYWIVGCLGYRGYFARADAEALAAELRGQGFDVSVRPVRAYSTLGWFDDPLLNTFVEQDELDMMATLIHEQAHRRVWVNGDTEFNESFAVFVEQEGLRRYLERQTSLSPPSASPRIGMARYEAYNADRGRFQAIALAGRERLAALYASPLTDAEKRASKIQALDAIREDYQKQRSSFKLLNYDDWFGPGLNNATLAGVAQYHVRLDAFMALFDEQARDFSRFYAASEALGKLSPADRQAALDRLAAAHAASVQRLGRRTAFHAEGHVSR